MAEALREEPLLNQSWLGKIGEEVSRTAPISSFAAHSNFLVGAVQLEGGQIPWCTDLAHPRRLPGRATGR